MTPEQHEELIQEFIQILAEYEGWDIDMNDDEIPDLEARIEGWRELAEQLIEVALQAVS